MQAPLAASQNKSVNQYRTVRHRARLLFQVTREDNQHYPDKKNSPQSVFVCFFKSYFLPPLCASHKAITVGPLPYMHTVHALL